MAHDVLTAFAPSKHVRIVGSFAELVGTPFGGNVNALCWQRKLGGDFREILDRLDIEDSITTIGDNDLRALDLSAAGSVARDRLLADQALLRERGLAPSLDAITAYPRDETAGPFPTDVYSFHVDCAPVETDTYLCTYTGACSEALANEDAVRRIDFTATRAAVLHAYGGADDANFAEWLHERSFDLHFAQMPGTSPYQFGTGNLWRIAIEWPGNPVLPCIHRAPLMPPGAPARLLLIS